MAFPSADDMPALMASVEFKVQGNGEVDVARTGGRSDRARADAVFLQAGNSSSPTGCDRSVMLVEGFVLFGFL